MKNFLIAMTAMALLFVFGLALAADHSPPVRAASVTTSASTENESAVSYSVQETAAAVPYESENALQSGTKANLTTAQQVRSGAGISQMDNPIGSTFDEQPVTLTALNDSTNYESPPLAPTGIVSNKVREKI